VIRPQGRFDPGVGWEMVERWKVSNMFTVPTIVKMLVEHPSVDQRDHSSLRFVVYAGAPMYREDQKHALATLGPVLVQYYGLGEVTGAITVLRPQDHHAEDGPGVRVGTCGIERTGIEVAIQDDKGAVLKPFETGEISVIGPAVCAGYYDDDSANAKAFRDGWFLTGDLGHMDEQGYIYITGRASDMYISGGSNVYPREVEEVLFRHPAIKDVVVAGVPDRLYGEAIKAYVVVQDGQTVTEQELILHCRQSLARFKVPASIAFRKELPKTVVGKVLRRTLQKEETDAMRNEPVLQKAG
jgi:acyl-CoA synthetase (AMP-forming)/AMP-acid ligase II